MTDLIDRKAAIVAIETKGRDRGMTVPNICNYREIVQAVQHVDAVPVVRCKDCKFSASCIFERDDKVLVCKVWNDCTPPDGYCYHAERKEDEPHDP